MAGKRLGLLVLGLASCGECAKRPPISTTLPPPSVRAALVAAGDSILFQEDFASGVASGWTGQVGTWVVRPDSGNFVYANTSPSIGDNWTVYGPATWTDYAMEARVKILSFPATAGIVRIFARWQNPTNWYYVNLTKSGFVQLRRYRNGAILDLGPPKAFPVTLGRWYTMRLECRGPSLKAYVNGVLQVSATDTLFKAGPIALGGNNSTEAFDDVKVVALGAAPPPPPPPPPPPGIAGVTVSPTSVAGGLVPGLVGIVRFRATVFDSTATVVAKSVAWSSSDPTVATVDTAGLVLLIGIGRAMITATIGPFQASGQVTVDPPKPRPLNGIYAEVSLRNGRLQIARRDSGGSPPVLVTAGDTSFNGFRVRTSTAPIHAAALRQLASDLPGLTTTRHFQTDNDLSVDSVFCAATGCQVKIMAPGHAPWISTPPVGAAVLLGLAHALEAAARGDTLFAPGDSLPYVRVLP